MQFPSYEQFKEWLESKPLLEVVGKACLSGECPGANLAKDYGAPDPRISTKKWTDGGDIHPLPDYMQRFVHKLDVEFEPHAFVTAEQALSILRAVAP